MGKNIKYLTAGQVTDHNTAHAHCMFDTWGYKHALVTCNTFCYATKAIVARNAPLCYFTSALKVFVKMLFPYKLILLDMIYPGFDYKDDCFLEYDAVLYAFIFQQPVNKLCVNFVMSRLQISHYNLKNATRLPTQTPVSKRRTVRRICSYRSQTSCPAQC